MTRKPHNYETHKTTSQGKLQTLQRKQHRAHKYGTTTPNAHTLALRISA
jgi:hypothetical protein